MFFAVIITIYYELKCFIECYVVIVSYGLVFLYTGKVDQKFSFINLLLGFVFL